MSAHLKPSYSTLSLWTGAALAAAVLVQTACSSDDSGTNDTTTTTGNGGDAPTTSSTSATGGGGAGGEDPTGAGGSGGDAGAGGSVEPASGAIAAGWDHSCVSLSDGSLKCWGTNDFGQLGDESDDSSDEPVNVKGLTGVTSLGAGMSFSCGVKDDGTLWCWGNDAFGGTLGNGGGESAGSNVPVQASLDGDAVLVAAGIGHACAGVGKEVYCWGTNAFGQIGQPDDVNSADVPTKVEGLPSSDVVSVAAGHYHSCAAFANGEAYCWGRNDKGQLGDGNTGSGKFPDPVKVDLPGDATIVAAGELFSCALLAAGEVACWGHNNVGQIGVGSILDQPTPVLVHDIENVSAIAAGGYHACAVVEDGEIRCWGLNGDGQLGNNATDTGYSPVTVLGEDMSAVSGARLVAGGRAHTCAYLNDGKVLCWGDGDGGQLGNGQSSDSLVAISPSGL